MDESASGARAIICDYADHIGRMIVTRLKKLGHPASTFDNPQQVSVRDRVLLCRVPEGWNGVVSYQNRNVWFVNRSSNPENFPIPGYAEDARVIIMLVGIYPSTTGKKLKKLVEWICGRILEHQEALHRDPASVVGKAA